MVVLAAVDARVVSPAYASSVVGWAYDALRPVERRAIADENPDSFFNVIRSAADYLDEPVPRDLTARNQAALERLIATERYSAPQQGLYLYGLRTAEHHQVGIVADLAVGDYERGVVRAHERTRATKEAELAAHLRALRMQSSPVGLSYRADAAVDAAVEAATATAPLLDFTTPDGVGQRVWRVAPGAPTNALLDAFARIEHVYIIDGHHRVGAAAQVAPTGRFLAALIPHHQLHLAPFHRLVAGPIADRNAVFARLGPNFDVTPLERPAVPEQLGEIVLHLGQWWRLRLHRARPGRLAVDLADELVLAEAFGVADTRTDPRLEFVPGGASLGDLGHLARLAAERQGAALVLSPPTVPDVFAVADAGRSMPPKSTWFEPKLRSGIFVVHR